MRYLGRDQTLMCTYVWKKNATDERYIRKSQSYECTFVSSNIFIVCEWDRYARVFLYESYFIITIYIFKTFKDTKTSFIFYEGSSVTVYCVIIAVPVWNKVFCDFYHYNIIDFRALMSRCDASSHLVDFWFKFLNSMSFMSHYLSYWHCI